MSAQPKIETLTYYRNADSTRAFFLFDITPVDKPALSHKGEDTELIQPKQVILLEWGKPRAFPNIVPYEIFKQQVNEKKLILFTPTVKENSK